VTPTRPPRACAGGAGRVWAAGMSPTIPAQQPRRRVWRWVVGLGLGSLVLCSVWNVVMRNQAVSELRAAGLVYQGRENLWKMARKDWRGLFKRSTWQMKRSAIWTHHDGAMQNKNLSDLVPAFRRLGIQVIIIESDRDIENVDGLKEFQSLEGLVFLNCPALRNVDGIKRLTTLQNLVLLNCVELENVDALHGLSGLKEIHLIGCSKLSAESIFALKAALPKTQIFYP